MSSADASEQDRESPDAAAEALREARKLLQNAESEAIQELAEEVDDVLRRYLGERGAA